MFIRVLCRKQLSYVPSRGSVDTKVDFLISRYTKLITKLKFISRYFAKFRNNNFAKFWENYTNKGCEVSQTKIWRIYSKRFVKQFPHLMFSHLILNAIRIYVPVFSSFTYFDLLSADLHQFNASFRKTTWLRLRYFDLYSAIFLKFTFYALQFRRVFPNGATPFGSGCITT
jgi:hypothetical protein